MGISPQQHRVCIGLYNNVVTVCPVRCHVSLSTCLLYFIFNKPFLVFCGLATYFYILCYIIFLIQDCAVFTRLSAAHYPNKYLILEIRSYLNYWFLILTFSVIETKIRRLSNVEDCTSLYSIFKHFFGRVYMRKHETSLLKMFLKNSSGWSSCVFIFLKHYPHSYM